MKGLIIICKLKVLVSYDKDITFTPLFFSPSSDKFGAESRYIQLFAPTDNIFIEVITTTEYKMNGLLKNHVDGTSREIEFQSFSLKDGSTVFHSTITGWHLVIIQFL